jgi:LuxR family maltose regulon positive regulatory protein
VRERLVLRLAQAGDALVALLVAPAGYGKTTLLFQWARHDPRPFALVTAREADDDPHHLLGSVVRALSQVAPIDDDVLVALSVGDVLDRLGHSLAGCSPFVLALDDVDALASAGSRSVLAGLADRLPTGSQLAIASRGEPPLAVGRLRAKRRLLELRAPDLAMTRREAAALLGAAGLDLGPDDLVTLVRRTEGWAAGLSLAALAVREQPDAARAIRRFRGSHRLVADYLQEELMAGLDQDETRFLMETSVLDILSGPVCDATLGANGSGALLRDLARTNLLLEPLDRSDSEYRYHALFAEMLSAELRRVDPEREQELHGRAAAWYAERDDLDRAIQHAVAGDDPATAGELLWARAGDDVLSGRTTAMRSWLERFSRDEVAANPGLALTRAATHLVLGDRDLAEHWAAAAERALRRGDTVAGDGPALEAGVAILRAAVARDGLRSMTEDAATAYALAAEDSPWRALCCLLVGVGAHLIRDRARARSYLQEGARRSAVSAPVVQVLCLAQLALMAIDEEDWGEAEALSSRARAQVDRVGLGDCPISALVFAVSARVRAQRGRAEPAQDDRRAALALLSRLTDFVPWYTSEVRTVLAGAAPRLGDIAGTRALLGDASSGLHELPEAVVLAEWIAQSSSASVNVAEAASLTAAELRVLQLLPTHLSFREMAGGLHVSANTVKTHAHAVYRKLDARSRSEAVMRAREAGLLGDPVDEFPARPAAPAASEQPRPNSLTLAELRVLRLLPSELSFAEIGSRLRVSATMVKTHADAAYRKLAACSRSEAVERARDVGLLTAPTSARTSRVR